MLLAAQVGTYYKDLKDSRVVSALALVHQRFSTNTFPTWDLAHPFRIIATTARSTPCAATSTGSVRARAPSPAPILGKDLDKIWPLIYRGPVRFRLVRQRAGTAGDERLFDRARHDDDDSGGVGKPRADGPRRRAFYEYHAAMMEPWDGPAAIAFTDGRQIGATLDRNGLRPARYIVTDDDLVIMASECGCLPVPRRAHRQEVALAARARCSWSTSRRAASSTTRSSRRRLPSAKPYAEWIERIRVKLDDFDPRRRRRCKSRGAAARPPAGVRLHAGGHQVHPDADGRGGRRTGRLDGQRLAAGGALEQEQDALSLLQAAVRAGDQSRDRSDPRGAGDVAGLLHRTQAESARHRRD